MAYGFNDDKSKVEVVKKDNFVFYRRNKITVPANSDITISVSDTAMGITYLSKYAVIGAMLYDYTSERIYDRSSAEGEVGMRVYFQDTSMNIHIDNNYSEGRSFSCRIMLMKTED